ncbi:hypothetical protein ES705_50029 [subsurface metagenome]
MVRCFTDFCFNTEAGQDLSEVQIGSPIRVFNGYSRITGSEKTHQGIVDRCHARAACSCILSPLKYGGLFFKCPHCRVGGT